MFAYLIYYACDQYSLILEHGTGIFRCTRIKTQLCALNEMFPTFDIFLYVVYYTRTGIVLYTAHTLSCCIL